MVCKESLNKKKQLKYEGFASLQTQDLLWCFTSQVIYTFTW